MTPVQSITGVTRRTHCVFIGGESYFNVSLVYISGLLTYITGIIASRPVAATPWTKSTSAPLVHSAVAAAYSYYEAAYSYYEYVPWAGGGVAQALSLAGYGGWLVRDAHMCIILRAGGSVVEVHHI
jgi:hypothetical protein